MTSPVRVGVIGLGAIGQSLLKAFTAEPDVQVTAVCDVNASLAESTARPLAASAWTDHRRMLDAAGLDLVYVAVPPRHHHAIALDVIATGRHILCEKPLALTLSEAQDIERAAQAAGVVHALNLPLHADPGIETFRHLVEDGSLGIMRRAELTLVFPQWPRAWQHNPWIGGREQGGPIREVGPHLLHVILTTLGPVKRVWAHAEYPADDPLACETAALGTLELANGTLVVVSCLTNVPRPEQVSLTVYGSGGTAGLVNWAVPVAALGQASLDTVPVEGVRVPAGTRLVRALVSRVRGAPGDLVDFTMGVRIQAVLESWERSSALGTWVDVAQA
ncbi:Gfo/Idh/MocA family oxidoreductase [Deinococcus deserti]|uniref:Putative dehydrogenase n=1 Tax=Deinococcus deserti (strain DSM 17065 / CIP 109153 / LMG 22923 / VCD115) TaxID=546414 RepID=C1D2A2_DEIDV|nr:Gfo/Idh/MocA family oxidoreductase [Deinococcus deserti]ACO47541.1 putative dehydrogenase [Deinococcus deserti VCD115]